MVQTEGRTVIVQSSHHDDLVGVVSSINRILLAQAAEEVSLTCATEGSGAAILPCLSLRTSGANRGNFYKRRCSLAQTKGLGLGIGR